VRIISQFAVKGQIHCVIVDRVTSEQRDTIKRTSSERLRARLEQAGWSSADTAALDRDRLMDAVAELYIVPAAEAAVELSSAQALSAKELELREREKIAA